MEKYIPGFEVTTNDRHGTNRQGEYVELPQSDLKGFSLAPDGSFLYTQSLWRQFRGNFTSLVVDGVRHQIMKGNENYRSRWSKHGIRKDCFKLDVGACGNTKDNKLVAWKEINDIGMVTFYNQNGDETGCSSLVPYPSPT
ncbi:hypothetical protein N7491_006288 [Penicillium cf. griseofulvum]|uniref:Uncharacterized protein n=1 Tax=Penicillium cf. griseofulvum TaxID=2972120 RepID=A0A9W9M3D0_9EURO|nr:hypothetical protein N7472_010682 [Penicillium cf. griseofulvum]KAJ5429272.1 hypothetical protein N7491_006288 [Penicillium cf. griseofulvum]